jgi:hypothetical protein
MKRDLCDDVQSKITEIDPGALESVHATEALVRVEGGEGANGAASVSQADFEIIEDSFSSMVGLAGTPLDLKPDPDATEWEDTDDDRHEGETRHDTHRDPDPKFTETGPSIGRPARGTDELRTTLPSDDESCSIEIEKEVRPYRPGFVSSPAEAEIFDEISPDGSATRIEPHLRARRPMTPPKESVILTAVARRLRPRWNYVVLVLALFSMVGSITAIGLTPRAARNETIVIPPVSQTAAANVPKDSPAIEEAQPAPAVAEKPEATAAADDEDETDDSNGHAHASGLSAQLRVKAFPPSAFAVDGKPRGKTPALIRLKPGMHEIVLKGPNAEVRKIARFVGRGKNAPVIVYW